MEVSRRDSRGPDREWFQKEKQRITDEIREVRDCRRRAMAADHAHIVVQEMQEAASSVHILNQNMEHLNDVGQEVVAISSVWVQFLRQMTASNEKPR
ncbi:hypothetical protein PHMEG_000426 [Phytophthora megakarya]|uniref:Outer kinetochore protein DAD1 n=1 Tax=Phytophthora megakarya TaxID=4795 RepID=A0A225X351_9STRA|nr:hypothetical protein PHMEG_000426 [Phytophthora megakarya]